MSLEEKRDSTSGNGGSVETSHAGKSRCNVDFALEANICQHQLKGKTENANCSNREEQSSFVLPPELEENNKPDDSNSQQEKLTINKKLAMLQNVFKTVSGDLEDIKALMLKLREILNNDCSRENLEDTDEQRLLSVGESSKEVIVIDDDEDDEYLMQGSQLSQTENNFGVAPTRASPPLDDFGESKYSTLVADIEVLKNKLVALKRNLSE